MVRAAKPIRLAELAEFLGRSVEGNSDLWVHGFGSLESARNDEIAFVRSVKNVLLARESNAVALVAPADVDVPDRSIIRSEHPLLDFSKLVTRLAPDVHPAPGVAVGAHVSSDAQVHPTACVASGAVVGARSRVGARSVLHPGVTLYQDVEIGEDCLIHAGVVLREGTLVGNRVVLQPGAIIGAEGFGYVGDEMGRLVAIPQRGIVVLEDDVEVGANTTIDRATLDETRICQGVKIDNLVQIGHNCEVGEGSIIVAQSGLSGSTRVGRFAMIMAQAGVAGHLRIGDGAFVAARAGIHKDVPDGGRVWGAPQMEERRWHRAMAALGRLPELLKRVRRIEKNLGVETGAEDSSETDSSESEQ